MNVRQLPVALLLFFSSAVAFGCSADASAPTDAPDQGQGEDDLTKALSQDMICAAVKAADDSNDGTDLRGIAESQLKGDAQKDFKSWQKGMVSDYPSAAYDLPVKLGSKTYSFVLVVEDNDGGGSMGVYRTNGQTVATIYNGESEPGSWSKPADKCEE